MIGEQLDLYDTGALGTVPDRVDPLAMLIAAWLVGYESPHTVRAYRRDVELWVAWCRQAGGVDVMDARRAHVDAWARSGAGFTKTPAASSLARRLSAVAAFYDYAVTEEITDRNPVANVRRPSIDKDYSGTRGLTSDEAKVLLIAAREQMTRRDEVAVRMLLQLGLRVGSVVAANVEGLHLDRGHRVLTTVGKGAKLIQRPLPPAVAHSIDTYLAGRAGGPLLVTATGRRVDTGQLFRVVQRAAALAGIVDPDTVTPHSLRHTFATLALDAGAQLHEVQDSMGHADPRTTRKYDRARGRLERDPAYLLSTTLAE